MTPIRYRIEARAISKKFTRAPLFKNISISLSTGDSICVTGPNGSGKSTLLRILAGLQAPSSGVISHGAGEDIPRAEWSLHTGYTGPLVNPYDELTAIENIQFALNIQDMGTADSLLDRFGLERHGNTKVGNYSTGMKQRLKIVLAALNDPPVLIFDEPSTGLDAAGNEALGDYINSSRSGKIIIIATNDPAEEGLCSGGLRLGS